MHVAAPWVGLSWEPRQPLPFSLRPSEQEKQNFVELLLICCCSRPQSKSSPSASPKTTTGVPREGPNPREKSLDRESFYFLSVFAFSRARLDYSFQQHKVLVRLSSQRSIFSALGQCVCAEGSGFFSFPIHCAETWWVTPGAVAAAVPEGGWQGTCASPHWCCADGGCQSLSLKAIEERRYCWERNPSSRHQHHSEAQSRVGPSTAASALL